MASEIPRSASPAACPAAWEPEEVFLPLAAAPAEVPPAEHPCLKGLAEIWNPLSRIFSACCEGQITAHKTYAFFGHYPLVLDASRRVLDSYRDQPLLENTLNPMRRSLLRIFRQYGGEDRRISQAVKSLKMDYCAFIEEVDDSSAESENAAKRLAQTCRKTYEIFARNVQLVQKDLQIIETRTLEWFDLSSAKESKASSADRLTLYDPFSNDSFVFSHKDPDDLARYKQISGFLYDYSTILNNHREFFFNALKTLSQAGLRMRQLAEWADQFKEPLAKLSAGPPNAPQNHRFFGGGEFCSWL